METLKTLLGMIVFAALAGCGVNQRFLLAGRGPANGAGTAPTASQKGVFLKGRLPIVDGNEVDLDSLKGKTVVLMFASDTCEVCLSEAISFLKALTDPTSEPSEVRFLTAVVAVTFTDSSRWKNDNHIPWSVGWDEKLTLFNEWCGGGSVPCTIVQSPSQGIILRHKGEISMEEIRRITGPWEKKP